MSDANDRSVEELTRAVVRAYELIRKITRRLPIPVILPGGPLYDADTINPAVARASVIIQDLPMDDEIRSDLWGACLHWLSASKVLMWLINHPDDPTATAEIMLLLIAATDAAVDAGAALAERGELDE
ncbi:hypothetical protein ACGF1Z_31210 [Streptomyces sp. NPDC048018]|uniref:hypothetical protein n=1 Tax=Streptomyces sp. NPDC048018 TaxID=3365499 RepID=UPI0037157A5F